MVVSTSAKLCVPPSVVPPWKWLRHTLVPPAATTLTVDNCREEVEEMLASERRAITRGALQEKFGVRNLNLSLERLEFPRHGHFLLARSRTRKYLKTFRSFFKEPVDRLVFSIQSVNYLD
jgi:hypothetical protein